MAFGLNGFPFNSNIGTNMEYLKYVYYAFGGFIGFVCGLIIQLIFMKLEDSKTLLLSSWVEHYGVLAVL